MSEINPLLREEPISDDSDRALRPKSLSEFIGQSEARSNLRVFIESARKRKEAMDHTLFFGPPGLGKTTLAEIISRELGVNFKSSSGAVLAKAGDLAAILTNLDAQLKSILFYRSLLQWIGGLGIIVLALALFPLLGIGGMQLYRGETQGSVSGTKLRPKMAETGKSLWFVYLLLTAACSFCYFVF